jgi:hypothetical protein
MRYIILILAVIFVKPCFADGFKYKTESFKVDSTGYYRVKLSPRLVGESRNNFADLRVFNSNNDEVAYVSDFDIHSKTSSKFQSYPIVSRLQTDTSTVIVFRNTNREQINNIRLIVGNAEVTKNIRITGSNDRVNWYSVKESETIQSLRNPHDVTELMTINFPLINYEYLQLHVNDRHSAPINIIDGGYFVTTVSQRDFTQVESSFHQSDSAKLKKTFIELVFLGRRLINRIDISITHPSVFHRSANIYFYTDAKQQEVRKLTSVILTSGQPLSFDLGEVFSYGLLIEVFNDDNQPIQVSNVSTFMLNRFCIAEFNTAEEYYFAFGNDEVFAPRYDLVNFKELFKGYLPVINHGEVIEPGIAALTPAKPISWYQNPIIIWVTIIVVILLLGYITFGMMKDKNQPHL